MIQIYKGGKKDRERESSITRELIFGSEHLRERRSNHSLKSANSLCVFSACLDEIIQFTKLNCAEQKHRMKLTPLPSPTHNKHTEINMIKNYMFFKMLG